MGSWGGETRALAHCGGGVGALETCWLRVGDRWGEPGADDKLRRKCRGLGRLWRYALGEVSLSMKGRSSERPQARPTAEFSAQPITTGARKFIASA